jgi:DNA segregation ATPase FtsK/SpoIIIE, S-DNA-T family
MATKRRTPPRRSSPRRRSGTGLPAIPLPSVAPDVARSILGIVFLVLGAVTLIALALPGQGALTDWWRDSIAPWFETGRWLLPFLLLGAGAYLEVGPGRRPNSGWGATIVGVAIAYIGFLGAFEVLHLTFLDTNRGGGRIGRFLAGILEPLLTTPGAFVVCSAILAVGLMVAFNLQFKELLRPVLRSLGSFGHWMRATAAASFQRDQAAPARTPAPKPIAPSKLEPRAANGSSPTSILDEPAARGGPAPMSQTVWTGSGDGVGVPSRSGAATALAARPALGLGEPPTALESLQAIDWTLPPIGLLDPRPAALVGGTLDHESNKRRIEEKLLSFAIPARVVAINSGPVVTQYEVKPEHHVKVSRIEALADDLAMALSARSIRIEAPIPGKDVVGIEIPNSISEVVGFRPLVEETNMLSATSPLTMCRASRSPSTSPRCPTS